MAQIRPVVFKIHGCEYAIDIMYVNAIERVTSITHVPNAPDCIKGMINLRGEVIPIYNLRKKFKFPDSANKGEITLIILNYKDVMVGLEVDEVTEIKEISTDILKDTPSMLESTETEYIDKVANLNNRMVIMLNVPKLINREEEKEIRKVLEDEK